MDNNINQPKTLEDLDKIIEKTQTKQRKSIIGYVVGGLILPPFSLIIALFLAWRRNVLHLFLPTINIVNSLLSLVVIALSISSLNPVLILTSEFREGPVQLQTFQIKIMIGFAILLAILGFVSGIIFRNKAIKENQLNKSIVILLLFILAAQYFVDYFIILAVNKFIYQSIQNIGGF